MVEIITWNGTSSFHDHPRVLLRGKTFDIDYGESSYIGPIGRDQPGSNPWVDGFPHTGMWPMFHSG